MTDETGAHGAAFSGRLGWGRRPALLVVDLVRAYFDPDGPLRLDAAAGVEQACAELVTSARAGGRLVVYTVVRYAAGGADAGLWPSKVPALRHFEAGAPGGWGELVSALNPMPGEPTLVKQHASAFAGTSLAATLTAAGVDTVVVCGVSLSGCVRATATDAIAHGFRPMVVRQACGERTEAIAAANLADLDAKYADVVELDEALTALRG